jgi:UTP--glucose-1-phosphate uridylyltransferase
MKLEDTLRRRMEELGIDVQRSLHILERLNAGGYDHIENVVASGIPEIDGVRIIDRTGPTTLSLDEGTYRERMRQVAPEIPAAEFGSLRDGQRVLEHEDLQTLGILLYPYVSYGVLNGGSATSYGDRKKNRSFDEQLFRLYEGEFEEIAPSVSGRPKGITPAYINPDGTPGASFLELKFRMILLATEEYRRVAGQYGITPPVTPDGDPLRPALPMVEMTSLFTEDDIRAAYREYEGSPFLASFHRDDITAALQTESAVQPLLAAMTHSSEGRPRSFFTNAWGTPGEPLGLPGGHGQNFQVLAPVYRKVHRMGKRLVYMGNVDNLGFTLDAVSIATVLLREAQGGFDFAFHTPVDVKGGVLLYDQHGGLNCADIGPAISRDEVFAAEQRGKKILFNCATGLFNLDYLVPRIDDVVENLPVRISDQDKDAGKYSQAEQVTWEIIGMLDNVLIFGIDKYRRFLAAKMLLDMFLTSGLHRNEARAIQPAAENLAEGLDTVLREDYGIVTEGGRRRPVS